MVFVGRPGSRFVIAGRQWRGIMLLGLGGVFWALVVAQVFVFVPRTASLYDLSFGFGPYVREMITTGQYADCTNAVCDHAARLPLLVWIAAALGTISPNQQLASVMKDLAFAAASLGLLAWLWRKLPQSPSRFWVWLVVAVVMVIGIPASKHASQLNYEEGLGIPLLFMLGLTGPLAISGAVQEGFSRRLMGLSLGLACLLYLLKASLLIVFGVTALATAAWAVWVEPAETAARARRAEVTAAPQARAAQVEPVVTAAPRRASALPARARPAALVELVAPEVPAVTAAVRVPAVVTARPEPHPMAPSEEPVVPVVTAAPEGRVRRPATRLR